VLGGNIAKQIGSVNIKSLNASAEIKGNVTFTRGRSSPPPGIWSRIWPARSRSATAAWWWPAPAHVPAQVKPIIDKNVTDQISAVETACATTAASSRARGAMGQGLPLDSAAGRQRGSTLPQLGWR